MKKSFSENSPLKKDKYKSSLEASEFLNTDITPSNEILKKLSPKVYAAFTALTLLNLSFMSLLLAEIDAHESQFIFPPHESEKTFLQNHNTFFLLFALTMIVTFLISGSVGGACYLTQRKNKLVDEENPPQNPYQSQKLAITSLTMKHWQRLNLISRRPIKKDLEQIKNNLEEPNNRHILPNLLRYINLGQALLFHFTKNDPNSNDIWLLSEQIDNQIKKHFLSDIQALKETIDKQSY